MIDFPSAPPRNKEQLFDRNRSVLIAEKASPEVWDCATMEPSFAFRLFRFAGFI